MTKFTSPLEDRIIEIARQQGMLAEVCDFVEYDPYLGRVPEHWRVKYTVLTVAQQLIQDGIKYK